MLQTEESLKTKKKMRPPFPMLGVENRYIAAMKELTLKRRIDTQKE